MTKLPDLQRRRLTMAFAAMAASIQGCGGGGSSTPTPSPNPSPSPSPSPSPAPSSSLAIASLSTTTPSALTPVSIVTAGVDFTSPFKVTLADASGSGPIALTPLRVDAASGTVVVAMPLNIDATAAKTTGFSGQLSISQGGQSSAPSAITVSDLPQLSDLGVGLGVISRAFYIHSALVASGNLNAQQAIALVPGASVNNASLKSRLSTQLSNVITARNDIENLISGSKTSIAIGTAADGTPVNFTKASLELHDRILGQYILSFTANGTIIPQDLADGRSRPASSRRVAAAIRARRGSRTQGFTIPPGSFTAITQAMTAVGGWVGVKTSQQTLDHPETDMDSALASASLYQTRAVIGTTAVALGAAFVGAPVVAALAGSVLTYELLFGAMLGAVTVGNDIYNVATTGYAAYRASGQDDEKNNKFAAAAVALTTDAFTTTLNAVGVGAFASGGTIVGNAAVPVFESLWGNVTGTEAAWAAAGLASSTANLMLQRALEPDAATTGNGLTQLSQMASSPEAGLGTVNGSAIVSNPDSPDVAPLTGARIADDDTAFTSLADPGGDYSILVPLDSPSVDYPDMTCSAYDPGSGATLTSQAVDLSDLTSSASQQAPILSDQPPTNPASGPTTFSGSYTAKGTTYESDGSSDDAADSGSFSGTIGDVFLVTSLDISSASYGGFSGTSAAGSASGIIESNTANSSVGSGFDIVPSASVQSNFEFVCIDIVWQTGPLAGGSGTVSTGTGTISIEAPFDNEDGTTPATFLDGTCTITAQ